MSFSSYLRTKAEPIWAKELEHPFVKGIGEGSLDEDKFKFYLRQDYLYLIEYSKVFALAVPKCRDVQTMQEFAKILDLTLNTEMELHRSYCREFGISPEELEKTTIVPTTYAYTGHLVNIAALGTLSEIVAALLPCAWGYCEIATKLADRYDKSLEHPLYGKWIATYKSEEFWQYVDWLKGLLDTLAEHLSDEEKNIHERHFIISSRYEYLFWEMAYKGEIWPV